MVKKATFIFRLNLSLCTFLYLPPLQSDPTLNLDKIENKLRVNSQAEMSYLF